MYSQRSYRWQRTKQTNRSAKNPAHSAHTVKVTDEVQLALSYIFMLSSFKHIPKSLFIVNVKKVQQTTKFPYLNVTLSPHKQYTYIRVLQSRKWRICL